MQKKYYNIGAGSFKHKNWINVDHYSNWYSGYQKKGQNIDVDWDLLSLTPISEEDNSAELVYSSHTIEHITNDAAQNMFNESYRILKSGGIIRLQAPDVDIFFNDYKNQKRIWWADKKKPKVSSMPLKEASIPQTFLWLFAANVTELHIDGSDERLSDSEIDQAFNELPYEKALDYCISKVSIEKQNKYPGNHMNWWNANKACNMLKIAGFSNPYVSSFGKSKSIELQNTKAFDLSHKEISLYIEAVK